MELWILQYILTLLLYLHYCNTKLKYVVKEKIIFKKKKKRLFVGKVSYVFDDDS